MSKKQWIVLLIAFAVCVVLSVIAQITKIYWLTYLVIVLVPAVGFVAERSGWLSK